MDPLGAIARSAGAPGSIRTNTPVSFTTIQELRPALHPAGGKVRFCQECGQFVSPGARFCQSCGAELDTCQSARPRKEEKTEIVEEEGGHRGIRPPPPPGIRVSWQTVQVSSAEDERSFAKMSQERLSTPECVDALCMHASPHALNFGDRRMRAFRPEESTMTVVKRALALLEKEKFIQAQWNLQIAHKRLLDGFTFSKVKQWADVISCKSDLNLGSAKNDSSPTHTTLGLVLHYDIVNVVLPGGPAFQAGLKKGDCILSVNGKEIRWPRQNPWGDASTVVKSGSQVQEALSETDNPGDKVEITYIRNGIVFGATMVRMSVQRMKNIRDWMELQTANTTEALKKLDFEAANYSSKMLEVMVLILEQHIQYEHMMAHRISELAKQSNMLVTAGNELLDRYEFKLSDAERRYQKITQVFNRWCIEQLGKKRLRHLTSRALSLWRKRAMSHVWNSWFVDHFEEKRLRHLTSRALSMLRNRVMCRAWNSWFADHSEEKRLKRLSVRTMRMGKRRLMALFWKSWRANSRDEKRLRHLTSRALRLWRKRAMSQVWNSWLVNHFEKKRLRHLTLRVLSIRKNRGKVSSGGGGNPETAGDVQELNDRQAMRDLEAADELIGHHHLDRQGIPALNGVDEGLEEAGHEGYQDAREETANETVKKQVGRNKTLQLFGSKVAPGYAHGKATIAALNNELMALFWKSWRANSRDEKRLRHLTSRALSLWRKRAMSHVWNSWFVDHFEEKRLRHLTSRALSMLRNRAMSHVWYRWFADHFEEKRLRHLTSRALSMRRNRVMSKNSWFADHFEEKRLRHLTSRALRKRRNRELCQAVCKWWSEVLRSRKTEKAVQMSSNRALRRAWFAWEELVSWLHMVTVGCPSVPLSI